MFKLSSNFISIFLIFVIVFRPKYKHSSIYTRTANRLDFLITTNIIFFIFIIIKLNGN